MGGGGVITLDGVEGRYGKEIAVADVTTTIRPGVVSTVLSRNAGGKSSLLRMISGVQRPSAGHITVMGRDHGGQQVPPRVLGAALDPPGWRTDCSAERHLRAIAAAHVIPSDRVDDVVTAMGLTEWLHRPLQLCTRHQCQRVALAAALLADPQVLVVDDPFDGLDDATVDWVKGLFRAAARAGRTVLIAVDRIIDLEGTVDHLLVLHEGRLVLDVDWSELRSSTTAGTVLVVTDYRELLGDVLRRHGAHVSRASAPGGSGLQVSGLDLAEIAGLARRNCIPVRELRVNRDSLDRAIWSRLTEAQVGAEVGSGALLRPQ